MQKFNTEYIKSLLGTDSHFFIISDFGISTYNFKRFDTVGEKLVNEKYEGFVSGDNCVEFFTDIALNPEDACKIFLARCYGMRVSMIAGKKQELERELENAQTETKIGILKDEIKSYADLFEITDKKFMQYAKELKESE